jgi:hypothetical protein
MRTFSNLPPCNGRNLFALQCCINMPQYLYAYQCSEMDFKLNRAIFVSFLYFISIRNNSSAGIGSPYTKPVGCIFSASDLYFPDANFSSRLRHGLSCFFVVLLSTSSQIVG